MKGNTLNFSPHHQCHHKVSCFYSSALCPDSRIRQCENSLIFIATCNLNLLIYTYTFKYNVSCTDGKISVRIKIGNYLYFQVSLLACSNICVLFCRPFVVLTTFSTSLVGCRNFFCLLTWAFDSNDQLPKPGD